MDLQLRGKLAPVTGITAGIGFAIAKTVSARIQSVALRNRICRLVWESQWTLCFDSALFQNTNSTVTPQVTPTNAKCLCSPVDPHRRLSPELRNRITCWALWRATPLNPFERFV